MKVCKIKKKIELPEEDYEGASGLDSGVLGGNVHGGDITNTDFYAPGDNRVPSLLFKNPLKRKKKLFENNIINESALSHQTLYRYTTLEEVMNLFSGQWKFPIPYGKSFTRNPNAPGLEFIRHEANTLLEIDKDALSRLGSGQFKVKLVRFFATYPEQENNTRNYSDEAEEQLRLTHKGSETFNFNPNKLSSFLKCIYIDINIIDEYDEWPIDKNEFFNLCKKFNIKVKNFNLEKNRITGNLDRMKNIEIKESVKASNLGMYDKTLKQQRNANIKDSMNKRVDSLIIDFLTLQDLEPEDRQQVEELMNSMSASEAFVKVVTTSPNRYFYLKLADENAKKENDKFFADIHKELRGE